MIKEDDLKIILDRETMHKVDDKIRNARIRRAILKGEGSCYGRATILNAIDERWLSHDYPREFLLLTYRIPIGKNFVERQLLVYDLFLEDYGCTDLELCERGLKEIFGELPELISKETITLFTKDAGILYDDIKSFADQILGEDGAYKMFDKFEAEHKHAEYLKEKQAMEKAKRAAKRKGTEIEKPGVEVKTETNNAEAEKKMVDKVAEGAKTAEDSKSL